MLARIQHFNRDNPALGIEIQHDAIRYFLAVDDMGIGKTHVESIRLGVIMSFIALTLGAEFGWTRRS